MNCLIALVVFSKQDPTMELPPLKKTTSVYCHIGESIGKWYLVDNWLFRVVGLVVKMSDSIIVGLVLDSLG